jgi:hypothetical protein
LRVLKVTKRDALHGMKTSSRDSLTLTESTAAVESPNGAVTVYRRHNKPALARLGDSLENLA